MFECNDDSVELNLFIKSSDCGRVRFKFDLPLINVSLRYFTHDYDDDFVLGSLLDVCGFCFFR